MMGEFGLLTADTICLFGFASSTLLPSIAAPAFIKLVFQRISILCSLCPAPHDSCCVYRGSDVSIALPPPRSLYTPSLFSLLRALVCILHGNWWIVAQALSPCMHVLEWQLKLEGWGVSVIDQWRLNISVCEPYNQCHRKGHSIYLSNTYKCVIRAVIKLAWSAPAEWFPRYTLQSHQPSFLRNSHSINAFNATSPVASAC